VEGGGASRFLVFVPQTLNLVEFGRSMSGREMRTSRPWQIVFVPDLTGGPVINARILDSKSFRLSSAVSSTLL